MAVLPTPASPSSSGLFLVRRHRIWITRSTSSSRPISGSNSPSAASWVRSRAYSVMWGVAWVVASASTLAPVPHHLLAELEQLEAVGRQVLGGGASLDPQQAQQQVLGPHRRVAHALGLVDREGQRPLGLLRQRQIGRRADAFERDPVAEQLGAQVLHVRDRAARAARPCTGSASRSIPSSRCSEPMDRLDDRLAS